MVVFPKVLGVVKEDVMNFLHEFHERGRLTIVKGAWFLPLFRKKNFLKEIVVIETLKKECMD